MLSFLFRILLLIGLLYFLRGLLQGLFGMGNPKAAGGRTSTNNRSGRQETQMGKMVQDPVCGTYIDARLAISNRVRGEDIYFCSSECQQKFRKQQGLT
jgi:YHS domain-containing protein